MMMTNSIQVNSIYQSIREVTFYNAEFWLLVLKTLCEDIERANFVAQPSINLYDSNDKTNLGKKNTKARELLATVDLQTHTLNVVNQFNIFIENNMGTWLLTNSDKQILAYACLLHDFGKSIELMTKCRIAYDVHEIRILGHQHASKRYLDLIVNTHCKYVKYNESMIEQTVLIGEIVAEHHDHIELLTNPLSVYLKDIDQKARQLEVSNA